VKLVGDLPPATDSPSHLELTYHDADIAGSLVISGAPVQFRLVGQTAYLNGTAAFWKVTTGSSDEAKIARLANRWISVPASETSFSTDLSLRKLTSEFQGDAPPSTLPVTQESRNGVPVYALRDGSGADSGTLTAAASSPHYLIELKATSGGQTVDLNLSEYGKTPAVTAPAGAVSVSQIQAGA
jgi:hypothetical protein